MKQICYRKKKQWKYLVFYVFYPKTPAAGYLLSYNIGWTDEFRWRPIDSKSCQDIEKRIERNFAAEGKIGQAVITSLQMIQEGRK